MNSSSKNTEKEYNNLSEAAAGGGGGGGGRAKSGDLLELTLGLGSTCSKVTVHGSSSASASKSSSSSSSFPSQPSAQSQELALRLGFETMNHHSAEPSENYDGLWWGNHHLSNSLPFPSSSSSSLLSSTMLHASTSSPLIYNFTRFHGLSWPVTTVGHHCSQRPHPGLWFSLRSIINRDGEVLPQIPKAYIRVKNENVTVFVVKTYLVRKLGLSNEAQVEISCLGQNLLHSQTMKNVRDEVWLPKFIEFLNSSPALVQNSQITTAAAVFSEAVESDRQSASSSLSCKICGLDNIILCKITQGNKRIIDWQFIKELKISVF